MVEWKSYSLAILIVAGTFALILQGILPPDGWWQGCTVAAGLYGARTVAKKLADAKNGKTPPKQGE